MNIIATIVPVFIVIALGLLARRKGFITPQFLDPANRLVYYIAIPAMIFNSIAKATLKTQMNPWVIMITLAALVATVALAWKSSRILKIKRSSQGTFIQCAFHGNLGYIGLAVAFYYLGDSGLVKAAIIAGFVMILQNLLAVIVLQQNSGNPQSHPNLFSVMRKTLTNPVILSAMAGILFSLSNLTLPIVIDRALIILKGMALPLALLIIGASLSFEKLKPRFRNVMIATTIKLVVAPALGLVLYKLAAIDSEDYLPGLIILAAPTATLTYVMAKEIGGDPDFAVAAISICTLVAGLTYAVWLGVA